MDILLVAVKAVVPWFLLDVTIVLIAVQFLPKENTEPEKSDSNVLH